MAYAKCEFIHCCHIWWENRTLLHDCSTVSYLQNSLLNLLFISCSDTKLNFDLNSRIQLLNPTAFWHKHADRGRVTPGHSLPISIPMLLFMLFSSLEFLCSSQLMYPLPILTGLPEVPDPSSIDSFMWWTHYWVWKSGKQSVRMPIGLGQSCYGYLNHEGEHEVRAQFDRPIRE